MKKLSCLFISLLCAAPFFAHSQPSDVKRLETSVQKVIQRVYKASVYITPYDSINKKATGGSFSGVVVDTAGYILSAAHAVKPNNLYEVTFPDGRKFRAIGLGRIPSNDAAVMKIEEKGSWPYAEMGWSSSLKKDMPCISIAYPGTLAAKTPTVRLGYVAETETSEGFIRTTCLMEPGDSGGPVFDMKGRVIGLHSKINLSLEDNFEIPIDLYRKYWSSLIRPASYVSLPAAESFAGDFHASALNAESVILNLAETLQYTESRRDKSVMVIKSFVNGSDRQILGTLIDLKGLVPEMILKGKSFLLSKSSMVGDEPLVELKQGVTRIAQVLKRDEDNDLVLLQVQGKINGGIALKTVTSDSVTFGKVGKFLVSPQPIGNGVVGVLGNTQFAIAKGPTAAYMGVNTSLKDGRVVISMVQPRSPASVAELEVGDELNSFNGKPVSKMEDLSLEISKHRPDDTLSLQLVRSGVPYNKQIVLKPRRLNERHIAYRFTDGRSERRDGFKSVLVHDGKLKPAECGGPLYDIDGNFYGINIARVSRTSSLAIPAATLSKFVKDSGLAGNLQTPISDI
ncbi:PDZ domain-containing protein [Pedobacter hiemivivus]|uniref:PDZ domain-containing protein n=1 Tax=Pedobacter hiemivivus TaxID=2530454 RepID=A0A4U1GEI8_9SPHI|nr:trypsin-like peptidase domain-containing protein [Pedobacter hiemivivus]TKC61409.1 PDZ domain-containing protein [Pedobacter hiemivivus]